MIMREGIANRSGDAIMSACTTKQNRRENSYSNVIREHVSSLNVANEEKPAYYGVVHTIMAEAGIIDSQKTADASEKDKRYKPFDNCPYGEFVNYEPVEGGRKRVNSYLLNEVGMAKVKEILTNYVTDRYLTKNIIVSAQKFRDSIKAQMDVEFLKTYLEYRGIPYKDSLVSLVFVAPSMENPSIRIPYTCYYNNTTKLQYANMSGKKDYAQVFWFIQRMEIPFLCNDTQEKAKRAARIFREWWNLQFNGKTEWGVNGDTKTSTEPVQSTPGSEPSATTTSPDLLIRLERMEGMLAAIMKALNLECSTMTHLEDEVSPSTSSPNSKTAIITKIKELAQPLAEQKRYKTISREQIDKVKSPKRKQLLQQAYDYLDNRRLLTAKYKPQDGWKFDFQKNNIELLYRVDNRRSAVYNTRHRPLTPFMSDGKVLKELANTGEKYNLPYGLEKIDYLFKTIFVTEGIFDSCFLKNCLAYSNWMLPHEMSKVIDIYREAGFQIIHILDNFRLGDKGGVKGLEHIVTRKEWLSKGDKVFSWDIYSDCDDINEIAMKHNLDEINPQAIIDHSWNEDEAIANYEKFTQKDASENEDKVASAEQDEPTSSTDKQENWSEFLSDEEVSLYVPKADKAPEPPQEVEQDEEWEQVLAEIEQEQKKSEEEQQRQIAERKQRIKAYEDLKEEEMWEMARTTQAIYNPQTYLYKTPGITISPSTPRV